MGNVSRPIELQRLEDFGPGYEGTPHRSCLQVLQCTSYSEPLVHGKMLIVALVSTFDARSLHDQYLSVESEKDWGHLE